jgi:hypothetical protein
MEPRLEALCLYCQVKAPFRDENRFAGLGFWPSFSNEDREHLATVVSSLCQRVREAEETLREKTLLVCSQLRNFVKPYESVRRKAVDRP